MTREQRDREGAGGIATVIIAGVVLGIAAIVGIVIIQVSHQQNTTQRVQYEQGAGR